MFYFRCIFYTFYTNTGKMITEAQKIKVRNKLLPYWLFYKVEHEVIDIAYKQMVLGFEDVQKYEVLIKQMIRISEKIFIEQIALLDRKEFITVLNDQYNNYNLKCSDMTDWLNTTYKLITKGFPNTQINLQSKSEFLDWYKEKIKSITIETPQQPKTNKPDELNNLHPKHNPNDWNTYCFELFKYLIDNYYKDSKQTNTKLICIWFYLSEYNSEKYILKITKKNYKIFIKDNYGITITNTDKPDNYQSKVFSTLHEHRKNFEDSLK